MKRNQIILISSIILGVVAIAVALFLFTPLKNIFKGSPLGNSLNAAIQSGRIEMSDTDLFIFVSAEEARKMLADAETSGTFKFLMPQFDVPESGPVGITIRNEEKETEDGATKFLIISGLPAGTTIYANSDRPAQGGAVISDNGFAWIRTKDLKRDIETITYIPVSLVLSAGQNPILSEINDEFKDMQIGSPMMKLVTDVFLSSDLFPQNSEVAYKISEGNDNSLADLKNLLIKDGKIVMVKN